MYNMSRSNSARNRVFSYYGLLVLLYLTLGLLSSSMAKTQAHSEGPKNLEGLIENPITSYMEITMFNWTNSDNVFNSSVKPLLTEMGPYVFREHYQRTNITWNNNGTVTFNQMRIWEFMPDMSFGSLEDEITNLNVISATVAYELRNADPLSILGGNALLNLRGGSLFVTKKVSELLFDGYDDPLLDFLNDSDSPFLSNFPADKFGWFVGRNGSWIYDGEFNIDVGEIDKSKLGTLHLWNGKSTTGFYSNGCSEINGITDKLWPPKLNTEQNITLFLTDICRSISLAPGNGSTWIGDERVFDNGENYFPNMCFCTGLECPDLKSGVLNVSDCQFGFPAFVSYPNFYLADPSFQDAVGLNATKDKHEFSVTLETNNGTLEVNTRLQMNILLQPISGLTIYYEVPHVMVPMYWFTNKIVHSGVTNCSDPTCGDPICTDPECEDSSGIRNTGDVIKTFAVAALFFSISFLL